VLLATRKVSDAILTWPFCSDPHNGRVAQLAEQLTLNQ
jgi:hypothetical protein